MKLELTSELLIHGSASAGHYATFATCQQLGSNVAVRLYVPARISLWIGGPTLGHRAGPLSSAPGSCTPPFVQRGVPAAADPWSASASSPRAPGGPRAAFTPIAEH